MLIHLVSVSLAANPDFAGSPGVVEMADAIWTATEGCAGRPGMAHPTVTLTRQHDPRRTLRTRPEFDESGLHAIDMVRDDDPYYLANAIAQAWYRTSPPALRYGMAEQLTLCVAASMPEDMLQTRPDLSRLDDLDDLKEWTDETELEDSALRSHHTAAWRLGDLVGGLLPAEDRFTERVATWDGLSEALADAPLGAAILAMLDGGAKAQERGLADPDKDGLLTVEEVLSETDPERWDTDGDGWWDGVDERPDGAIPVARDGSSVCLNQVARKGATPVEFGGSLHGVDLSAVETTELRSRDLWQLPAELVAGRGGHWVRPVGSDLVRNRYCVWTPEATVRVARVEERALQPLLDQGEYRSRERVKELTGVAAADLEAFASRVSTTALMYREALGPPRWRLQVDLGVGNATETRGTTRGPTIDVSTPIAKRSLANEKTAESVAHLIVAMQRLSRRTSGAAAPSTALLYAKHTLGRGISRSFVDVYAKDVRIVKDQFEEDCDDGWMDVFDGYCLERIYEDP